MLKRTPLNFAVDTAAFIAFLFLLSSGLLLEYQLPAGSGSVHGRGMGRGTGEQEISILWGRTRHEWGQIHYWIAGVLVALLAIHLVLHWKWIVSVIRGKPTDASGLRFGLGLASAIALIVLAFTPLLTSTERLTRSQLQQHSTEGAAPEHLIEIRGSMTIAEVAQMAGLSVAELLDLAGLPADTPTGERMGRILRQHGLQMSDLQQTIRQAAAQPRQNTSRP